MNFRIHQEELPVYAGAYQLMQPDTSRTLRSARSLHGLFQSGKWRNTADCAVGMEQIELAGTSSRVKNFVVLSEHAEEVYAIIEVEQQNE